MRVTEVNRIEFIWNMAFFLAKKSHMLLGNLLLSKAHYFGSKSILELN